MASTRASSAESDPTEFDVIINYESKFYKMYFDKNESSYIYFHADTPSTWFILAFWMQKCENIFAEMPDCNLTIVENYQENISHLRKHEYYRTLLLDLKVMGDVEASIHLMRNISKQFLDAHKCATDPIRLNYTISRTKCYDPKFIRFVSKTSDEFKEISNIINKTYTFQNNIQLNVSLSLVILGLFMSGIFGYLLAKHRYIAGETNAIILNISICDFVGLVVVFPIQHIMITGIYYSKQLINIYVFIIILLCSCSGISILALSIRRLLIVPGDSQRTCYSKIYNYCRTFICILIIWGSSTTLAALVSMIFLIVDKDVDLTFRGVIVTVIMINLFLLLLPIAVCVLTIVSSRKLRQVERSSSGENSQDKSTKERYVSSKSVALLCVTFWFTHAPIIGGFLLLVSQFEYDSLYNLKLKIVSLGIHIAFYLSACLNPLTHDIVRRNLREFCSRHFLRRRNNP